MSESKKYTVEVEVNEHLISLFNDITEKENWDGPEDFDEWAEGILNMNSAQVENIVEQAIFQLHNQVKQSENRQG